MPWTPAVLQGTTADRWQSSGSGGPVEVPPVTEVHRDVEYLSSNVEPARAEPGSAALSSGDEALIMVNVGANIEAQPVDAAMLLTNVGIRQIPDQVLISPRKGWGMPIKTERQVGVVHSAMSDTEYTHVYAKTLHVAGPQGYPVGFTFDMGGIVHAPPYTYSMEGTFTPTITMLADQEWAVSILWRVLTPGSANVTNRGEAYAHDSNLRINPGLTHTLITPTESGIPNRIQWASGVSTTGGGDLTWPVIEVIGAQFVAERSEYLVGVQDYWYLPQDSDPGYAYPFLGTTKPSTGRYYLGKPIAFGSNPEENQPWAPVPYP